LSRTSTTPLTFLAISIARAFSAVLSTVPLSETTPRTVSTSMLRAFTSSSAAIAVFTFAVIAASETVCVGLRCSDLAIDSWCERMCSFHHAQPDVPRVSRIPASSAGIAFRSMLI
jgi:hypothetical protein